jgi:hypothetical protein
MSPPLPPLPGTAVADESAALQPKRMNALSKTIVSDVTRIVVSRGRMEEPKPAGLLRNRIQSHRCSPGQSAVKLVTRSGQFDRRMHT